MIPLADKILQVDDLMLHKANVAEKIKRAIDLAESRNSEGMVKYASVDKDALVDLFVRMLKQLDLNGDEVGAKNFIQGLASQASKTAAIKSGSKTDTIKIVSKALKDSHYQVDVSKDVVKHKGKEVLMVSCYARDAYLGRYLIKRNYFFTPDREVAANQAYDEILTKVGALKDRYYQEILDVAGIFSQLKRVLDGVISEIDFKDD